MDVSPELFPRSHQGQESERNSEQNFGNIFWYFHLGVIAFIFIAVELFHLGVVVGFLSLRFKIWAVLSAHTLSGIHNSTPGWGHDLLMWRSL